MVVARHCFKVGMYWQGITHDRPSIRRRNSGRAAGIIRAFRVRTMQSARRKDILPHGCIIRDAISITTNTGSITV